MTGSGGSCEARSWHGDRASQPLVRLRESVAWIPPHVMEEAHGCDRERFDVARDST